MLFGHFYSHLSFLFYFSLSVGDSSIKTEILSQRAVKPKTTNQPITGLAVFGDSAQTDKTSPAVEFLFFSYEKNCAPQRF